MCVCVQGGGLQSEARGGKFVQNKKINALRPVLLFIQQKCVCCPAGGINTLKG